MYAAARDVTDKKAAEEAIQRLNDELQQRAQQLEEANRELEAFSYSVSHDLRAPLRHVQGYVQMLTGEAGEQLSDKAHHYLSTIRAASLEMGHLIDDLLAFSRMGRAEMRETTVNLEGLVDEVIQREYLKQGQEVTWRRGDLPVVRCDPAMLRQVVVNLVGNAIKFSQHRKPAEIEVGSLGEEDGRAIIFVKDNGAGFDMRFAHKLFGVFQRLHRADEFEGTGIGLATVRRIIARHGGRTWAEGKLNQGATFFFTVRKAES